MSILATFLFFCKSSGESWMSLKSTSHFDTSLAWRSFSFLFSKSTQLRKYSCPAVVLSLRIWLNETHLGEGLELFGGVAESAEEVGLQEAYLLAKILLCVRLNGPQESIV
jgi:hypothetical protein